MAYNEPPTQTTGDFWSAYEHNRYIKDNFEENIPAIYSAKGQLQVSDGYRSSSVLSLGGNNNDALWGDPDESLLVRWGRPKTVIVRRKTDLALTGSSRTKYITWDDSVVDDWDWEYLLDGTTQAGGQAVGYDKAVKAARGSNLVVCHIKLKDISVPAGYDIWLNLGFAKGRFAQSGSFITFTAFDSWYIDMNYLEEGDGRDTLTYTASFFDPYNTLGGTPTSNDRYYVLYMYTRLYGVEYTVDKDYSFFAMTAFNYHGQS